LLFESDEHEFSPGELRVKIFAVIQKEVLKSILNVSNASVKVGWMERKEESSANRIKLLL